MGSQEAAVPASYGDDLSPEKKRTLHRAIAASAMGNMTEWYDYGAYGLLAGTLDTVFFPKTDNPIVGLLAIYGVFAISFLIRPFGGLVFGPLGDRLGRQKILAITIITMSSATFCIGLIPSYATIGVASPLLLVLFRLIQGFSTGGEYGGAATFMAEYSPDKKRGFYGSFLEFGTLSGYLLGAAVVLIMQAAVGTQAMGDWGWRIPFLLAGPLGVIGLYLRFKLDDTPVFQELEASGGTPKDARQSQVTMIAKNWRPILICMGMVIMLNVINYTLLIYMPEYLNGILKLGENTGLFITMIVYAIMLLVINQAGRLSDHVGRKPLWYISGIAFIVLAIPAFLIMRQGPVLAFVGFAVLGIFYVLQLGTISATFPALFPTPVRYAGFAISYNVSTSLFGGTAPLVNTQLIDATGNNLMPAFYMMAACVIGLVALKFAPETAGASLRGTDLPDLEKQKTVGGPKPVTG